MVCVDMGAANGEVNGETGEEVIVLKSLALVNTRSVCVIAKTKKGYKFISM